MALFNLHGSPAVLFIYISKENLHVGIGLASLSAEPTTDEQHY